MLYFLQKSVCKLIPILCFAALFLCSKVFAAQTIDIGYGALHPPFVYKKNNTITGIDVDVLTRVLARQELSTRFYLIPWARAINEVKQGSLDGVLTVYCDDPSSDVIKSKEPVYSTRLSIFALKKNNYSIDTLHQPDKVINVVRGSEQKASLSSMFNLSFVESLDADTLLRQLLKGRVDFTLYERFSLLNQAKRFNVVAEVEEITHVEEKEVCLGFSALRFGDEKGGFIQNINQSISYLKESGQIDEIFLKHGVILNSSKDLTNYN